MWIIHSGEVNQGIIIVNVIKKAKITFQAISITRQKNVIWMKNQIRKLPYQKTSSDEQKQCFCSISMNIKIRLFQLVEFW